MWLDAHPLVLGTLQTIILLGLIVSPLAGLSTYIERRVSARIQSRQGCNRLGPEGLMQFLADGIKLITKEDIRPHGSDGFLFRFAPYLVVMGAFASFACIPFSGWFLISDIDLGLMYILALSSVIVIGIMLAGWSSNNKWSILGALRSAAQMVSYEIPLGLALIIPVLITGSLNLRVINDFQAGGVGNWLVFYAGPFTMLAFVIFCVASLAEVNRAPFDLPEAESELVSGYHTEYSGIRWGMFFVAEYAEMFLVSCIAVSCFLGGYQASIWNIPFIWLVIYYALHMLLTFAGYWPQIVQGLWQGRGLLSLLMTTRPWKKPGWLSTIVLLCALLLSVLIHMRSAQPWAQMIIFISKSYFFVFMMMWIRWSVPRYRVDQLMDLCWKKFVPLNFVCILATSIWMVLRG